MDSIPCSYDTPPIVSVAAIHRILSFLPIFPSSEKIYDDDVH